VACAGVQCASGSHEWGDAAASAGQSVGGADTGRVKPTLRLQFRPGLRFGCSITLAGYGYPYVVLEGPRVPVRLESRPTCDVWWNEVAADAAGGLWATGHRIADVVAVGASLGAAIGEAYANIRRIRPWAATIVWTSGVPMASGIVESPES